MLKVVTMAAAVVMASPALAQQQPDHHEVMAAQAEAMAPFQWMVGKWRGKATQRGPGGVIELIQTERAGPMLDGSVMVVEGRGYDPATGETEFNAIGVVSYDAESDGYTLRAHANGRYGEFPITLVEGGFDWSMQQGPATIRYEARGGEGKWTETGYVTMPGRDEVQFFRMDLERIGDSDWPLAGSVPMED